VSRSTRVSELFERIGYQPGLETRALASLTEINLAECRSALGELVGKLDLTRVDGDSGVVVQLLGDVLQRVNRRLHGHPGDETTYHANRLAILDGLARCRSAAEARDRFLPILNGLLAPLQKGLRPLHPLAIRATAYIDSRLSLSGVARSLAISPSYLSRLFRRETGLTLTAYIHRVRIERALVLLAEGARSISEIAYRVGYQNYRDFYRNFVRYENASPRQTRLRLKKARQAPGSAATLS
jgi:AraC-like DNA-binding protein